MTQNKYYNGSYIFSEALSTISDEAQVAGINSFPSLDFLEKKNDILNSFNNIDFYCLINTQQHGEFILEKNISLNIGIEKVTIKTIFQHIRSELLTIDAEMDKVFIEFHIHNKLEPLDIVLSNVNLLTNAEGEEFYLKRSVFILSNDQNGIPLFGFCTISVIEMNDEEFDPKNFYLHFTTPNKKLEEELNGLIFKSIN